MIIISNKKSHKIFGVSDECIIYYGKTHLTRVVIL